ncbi:TetR family transcriptional regulator [Streptomyces sp. MNU77]|uniref:TetR/AcrR family transcriptional regulator n=1 Tax=Streptomyces sp. MNU77 TaxID=1573406 RepID=UPI0005DC9CB2|nr:TetR/AcrR family transcriptional regulator [Streptomyces sp. MNU77]OLO25848.1 TetR family transcriptional regulator [Streptomyces sp. MNU77]
MSAERARSTDPRAERVRNRLKAAALDLVHEKRVEDVSVTDVVARAGTSRPVFYQHFHSRDDAVAAAFAEAVADRLAEDPSTDPVDRIHRVVLYATEHAALYANLYPSAVAERAAEAWREALLPACEQLARRAAEERGNGSPVEARYLASFLVGGLVELGRLWATAPGAVDAGAGRRRAAADGIVDTCLAVLGVPRQPSPDANRPH